MWRSIKFVLFYYHTPRNEVYWIHPVCLSVCLFVKLSCPPCSIYSSGWWILCIFGTNDQQHMRVCCMWWPLTLTYIFKVVRPWLRKSGQLCSVYSSGWIIFIFGKKWSLEDVPRVMFFFRIWKFEFLAIVVHFFWLDLEKNLVLDGFFLYLTQMITSMKGYVAYNDLWPWPIASRSFGLGLENRVRSVASTVLDGLFPYLVQMISSMRRCVACDDLWPWPLSSRSFNLDFENRVRSVTFSVSIFATNNHYH